MAMYAIDITTIPANLAGVPAMMRFPAGLSDDGLPVGFQFLAPQQRDEVMYKPAAALEAALEEKLERPDLAVPEDPVARRPGQVRQHRRKENIMAEKLMKYADAVKKFDPVIGLETHVELSTTTKLFCPAEVSLRRRAEHASSPR